jgi:hypothetical protein
MVSCRNSFLSLAYSIVFLAFSSSSNAFYYPDLPPTEHWENRKGACSTVLLDAIEPTISKHGTRRYPSRAGIVESLQQKYIEAQMDLIKSGGESNIYRLLFPNGDKLAVKVPNANNEYAHHAYRNEYERFFDLSIGDRAGFIPMVEFDPSGPFLIMGHIEGTDLGTHLSEYGPDADPIFILEALKEIATGLKVLHDKEIVHGDVKPSNIIVEETGRRFLVGDLSFATEFDGTLSYAPPGTIAGTKEYLPEDERNGYDRFRVHRDLYALKITTQALVLGEEPFLIDKQYLRKEKGSIGNIKVLSVSPSSIVDGISPILSAISFIEASSIDEYIWLIDKGIEAILLGNPDKFFIEAFGPLLSKRTAKEVAELIWACVELRDRLKFFFRPQKLGLSASFYKEVMVHYQEIKRRR